MAHAKPIYDLTLLLDLGAADELRAKIVADTRTAIEAEGELLGEQDWGTRQLSYEIDHREAAEYHLLQFSGPSTLIASLEHSLRITDGVIRHRVIKLPPGSSIATTTPAPAPVPAAASAPAAPAEAPATEAPAAEAPAPEAPAEAPATEAPATEAPAEAAPAAEAAASIPAPEAPAEAAPAADAPAEPVSA
jgi:small subunit ribosomal protein S6